MSHGFVDDIPGHTEFWRRYRTGCCYDCKWWKPNVILCKIKHKYGLLKRLYDWKMNIRKLKKIYPDYTLRELEYTLIEIESTSICRDILKRN